MEIRDRGKCFLEGPREVIAGKCGVLEGGWRTEKVTMLYGCGLWRNILKGWEKFTENVFFQVGNGRRVSFGDKGSVGQHFEQYVS